jgi:hypothetical protein
MEHVRNAGFGPLWKIFFAQGKNGTARAFAGFAAYWRVCVHAIRFANMHSARIQMQSGFSASDEICARHRCDACMSMRA